MYVLATILCTNIEDRCETHQTELVGATCRSPEACALKKKHEQEGNLKLAAGTNTTYSMQYGIPPVFVAGKIISDFARSKSLSYKLAVGTAVKA